MMLCGYPKPRNRCRGQGQQSMLPVPHLLRQRPKTRPQAIHHAVGGEVRKQTCQRSA